MTIKEMDKVLQEASVLETQGNLLAASDKLKEITKHSIWFFNSREIKGKINFAKKWSSALHARETANKNAAKMPILGRDQIAILSPGPHWKKINPGSINDHETWRRSEVSPGPHWTKINQGSINNHGQWSVMEKDKKQGNGKTLYTIKPSLINDHEAWRREDILINSETLAKNRSLAEIEPVAPPRIGPRSSTYRRKGLDHYGKKCARCGRTGGNSKRYEVHHINGRRDDDRIENLQVLCVFCHDKVHNYCED